MKPFKFKIEKHNKRHVYWLMDDIYSTLEHDKYLNQDGPWNWQIEYVPIPLKIPYNDSKKTKITM